MHLVNRKSIAFGAGLGWAALAGFSANAQDIELFVGNLDASSQAKPNILLILDDSGSMDGEVLTQNNYDPSIDYGSSCSDDRVYWTKGNSPPSCWTSQYFNLTAFKCKRALDAFAALQGGSYTDRMGQYDDGWQERWEDLSSSQKNRPVECQDDRPDEDAGWAGHGDGSDADEVYARNGNDNELWTDDEDDEISWSNRDTYNVYSGNYLNWYYSPGTLSTRMEVMQDVASNLVNSINGVNFGLMDFNRNTSSWNGGGLVSHAVEDVATGRESMLDAINALYPDGNTPLSETLHEAYQYLSGGSVVYGSGSVSAARSSGNDDVYESPLDLSCQKTHIVFLTDGEPTEDTQSDSLIPNLVDYEGDSFSDLTGAGTCSNSGLNGGGDCLDDLAAFMYQGDMSPAPGKQNIITHTVGFLVDLPLLADAAELGGGDYYTATDTASLTTALTSIITSILDTQATFTAPAVSINSFNQTRNLDDLYISVFRPSGTKHWPGNLKKYRLRGEDATIVDANDNPAVDPNTGFFSDTAQSLWSATVDGSDIEEGGAAHMIPNPRSVYTYFGNADLTHSSNSVAKTNTAVTDALLGTGTAGDPTRDQVIDFINGLDTPDVDSDNNLTESRNQMGDPLHAQPVSVVYGPTNDDARIYFATNDGYLHSIDAESGVEEWAFLPEEFLENQIEFFKDDQAGTGVKYYGLDGSLRVQTFADGDGVIEAGEKVYLFFGMRRGGSVYYGLDITNPDQPRVMWRNDGLTLPGVGQSWSSPMPARINVSGATQNSENLVLVFGGGYDPTQDNYSANTDTSGNSIYIVDSVSGALLWHGAQSGGDKAFANMQYSIPADVRVIDLNGDSFADRMYAADMGGQVWRFDVFNGEDAGDLVNGGVFARLGAAGVASPTLAETRRFYYAPDVALASNDEYSFIHVGIGSGYRAHPNETQNENRFYALRDYRTFSSMTQAEYDALTPISDADLVDVTTDTSADVPEGSAGWKLQLNDGGWIGEKVLAETRTFNNSVYVTTFRPGGSATSTSCEPALGTNRQYVMSLFNGAPVLNRDGSADGEASTVEDRFIEYQGAPPPETVFIFPPCVGDQCPPVYCVDVNCGLTNFPNLPIRTFWTQEAIE